MDERLNVINNRPYDYVTKGAIDPFAIPSMSSDPETASEITSNINRDVEAVVDFAFRWAIYGDTMAAQSCARILDDWASIQTISNDTDTILTWCNRTPALVQAAFIIMDSPSYTIALQTKLSNLFVRASNMTTAYTRENNWASWGLVYEAASASITYDRPRFDRCIQRFFSLMDASVINNIPIHEIYREGSNLAGNGSDGLTYSNFNLNALVQFCEWARFNGEWLYDYETYDGSSIKGYWENVRYWDRHPELYPYNTSGTPSTIDRVMPHVDVLHALYPHPDSQYLIETYPPLNDFYSTRNIVLSHRLRPLYG